ncbi:MAG: STAS domain-containing protein [Victivallaceae bacterium]|nr:STAS domain-containing protein [Victivallaceae bacterium]
MKIKSYKKNDVVVIELSGRLNAVNVHLLQKKFKEFCPGENCFVFDLGALEYLDSTGLGGIVSCLKAASDNNGDVKIACLQNKTKMVFEITRAYKIFDIFEDVDSAVAAFK